MSTRGHGNHSGPSIAVVIPNKNDAAYLVQCLTSVLDQPTRPDEIIVVDDGSTDSSVEIIRSRLADVPGAQLVINPSSVGTIGALNQGLQLATSEYAVFLASNDYFVNGFIAKAKASISRIGRPGVWSAMVWVVDETGKLLYLYPSAVVSQEAYLSASRCIDLAMMLGHWFTGTTLIYRRDLLQRIGGFDVEYFGLSDLLAALTIASLGGAGFVPEPLGVMRRHAGGYLARTLIDQSIFIPILDSFCRRGQKYSPSLFTRKFCLRTTRRLAFASLRALGAREWNPALSARIGRRRYLLLRPFIRRLPASLGRFKLAIAYLLLRPYDIPPALWYRVIGVMWVRLRCKSQVT
jgi:glycosyltransferase involved in cell wall biosynthesis